MSSPGKKSLGNESSPVKKFLGNVEIAPSGDLITSLPTVPPGQPEAQPVYNQQQSNHPTAIESVAPRLDQPLEQQPQAIAGVHSLPPTKISVVTGDGQVGRSELVMEENDDTGQQDKKSEGGKTGKDDVMEKKKESSTDNAQSIAITVAEVVPLKPGDNADTPLFVSKSGSEEPISKPDDSEDVKMKPSGAASESDKGQKDQDNVPLLQEFTSGVKTDTFNTKDFKKTSKIQKFSERLKVKWMKNIKGELIPHVTGTDNSCWTYIRISANVKKPLLTDMKARKEFATVRLATCVLSENNVCTQHGPVQVRENGEVCFMCKLLDTNKELSQWNERTFTVSLEVVLQIHSTCFLRSEEIESDFVSITEETIQ